MEKKLNQIEEMNEEIKVEELDMETLENVDGGSVALTLGVAAGIVSGAYAVGWAIGLGIANIVERSK